MQQILEAYPGAQRALFRKYHIGGCSSCAFRPGETLAQVCHRNNQQVDEVLAHLQACHQEDEKVWITAKDLAEARGRNPSLRLLDIRSRQEFEAVCIASSVLLSQPVMQQIMSHWSREEAFVIVDHDGRSALDAAAYFLGHGFTNVRCLKGGLDAWSQEVDPTIPRYRLA